MTALTDVAGSQLEAVTDKPMSKGGPAAESHRAPNSDAPVQQGYGHACHLIFGTVHVLIPSTLRRTWNAIDNDNVCIAI